MQASAGSSTKAAGEPGGDPLPPTPAAAARRPSVRASAREEEEEEEWEPGAYGLVDAPSRRPAWARTGQSSSSSAARRPGAQGTPRAGAPAHSSAGLPPPAAARTQPAAAASAGSTAAAGAGSSAAASAASSAAARRPAAGQPRPGSPFGFASATLTPATASSPPVLRLFPGQLRAQTSGAKKAAAAPPNGFTLRQEPPGWVLQRTDSPDQAIVVERTDSAAFGSELSYSGD